MGSQVIQSKLWGQRPQDWASIQEATGQAGYDFVADTLAISAGTNLLDVGCGTGYFCQIMQNKGAVITGLDATPAFVEEAQKRVPTGHFLVGEMEELPFSDQSFQIVCGFNSFQYAANTKNALIEAKRVLTDGGTLVVMIWGNKEDCEAASYLKAVGSLLPPPLPGAPGPFALSENSLLENLLADVGFGHIESTDVVSIWEYEDVKIAMKGLLSAGPVARAIENSGFDKVYETVAVAIKPYIRPNGHVMYQNKFRVIIARK